MKISGRELETFEKKVRVLQLFSLFIIGTSVLMTLIPRLGILPVVTDNLPFLKEALLGTALVVIAASFVVPRALLSKFERTKEAPSPEEIWGVLFLRHVVRIAMLEAVVILGFIIALLTANPDLGLLISAAAIGLMIVVFPRTPNLAGLADRLSSSLIPFTK